MSECKFSARQFRQSGFNDLPPNANELAREINVNRDRLRCETLAEKELIRREMVRGDVSVAKVRIAHLRQPMAITTNLITFARARVSTDDTFDRDSDR